MSTNFFPTDGTIQVSFTDENGYAMEVKCAAAAIPSAVAGYATGCELIAEDTGAHYYNTGDETSCTFVAGGTVTAGSIVNADISASAAIALSKLEAMASGTIIVGSAGTVATEVAVSGDATLSASGALTVTGAAGLFEAGGAITNAGGTLAVGFIPTAVTSPQALSAPGAANITTYQTKYTSTGAGDVVTLADATRIGHLKKISYVAEGAGGDTCVVTPTNLEGFTTATLAAIGDYVLLMWNGANWLVIENVGATLA